MTTKNFFEIEKITIRTYMPAGIAGIPYFGSSHLKRKNRTKKKYMVTLTVVLG
jgi:hypothetical protein